MANKKHVVMARMPNVIENGLETSKGHLDFKGKSMVHVDGDIADEIDQTQGLKGSGEVWVHEDPILNHTERYHENTSVKEGTVMSLHSYIFGPSRSYSNAWEAFEKRRKDKKRARVAGDMPEVKNGSKKKKT